MNSGKGSTILLLVIGVATLLVAVAGSTFAYFGAMSKDNEESNTVIPTVESKSGAFLSINDFTSEIKGTNKQFNEDIINKTFTVNGSVVGASNYDYEINLTVKENTYKDGALVYTLVSENVSNNGTTLASTSAPVLIPSGKSTINLGKGLFAGPTENDSVHKYTLKITYVNNDKSLKPDLEANFKALLNITKPNTK